MESRGGLSKKRNALWKVFLNLRGIAILGVLVAHSFSFYHYKLKSDPFVISLGIGEIKLKYIDPFISAGQQLPGFCVPLFLFIAGYSAAITKQSWSSVGEKIKRLLYPYLIWSIFGWIWTMLLALRSGEAWTFQEFLVRLLTGRTQSGYFFFVLIFQWYILSYWLVPMAKRHPIRLIVITSFIQLLCAGYNYFVVYSLPFSTSYAVYDFPFQNIVIERYVPLLYPVYPVLGMVAAFYSDKTKRMLDRPVIFHSVIMTLAFALFAIEHGFATSKLTALGYSAGIVERYSKVEWLISYELWGLVSIVFFSSLFRRKLLSSKIYQRINKDSYILFLLNGPCLLLLGIFFRALIKFGWISVFQHWYVIPLILVYQIITPLIFTFFIRSYFPNVQVKLLGQ